MREGVSLRLSKKVSTLEASVDTLDVELESDYEDTDEDYQP